MGFPDPFGIGGYPMPSSGYQAPPPESVTKMLLEKVRHAAVKVVFAAVAIALPTALAFWQLAKTPVPPCAVLFLLPVELLILRKLSGILEEQRGYKPIISEPVARRTWRLRGGSG